MDLGLDDVRKFFEDITNLVETESNKNLLWILGGAAFLIFVSIMLFLKMFT